METEEKQRYERWIVIPLEIKDRGVTQIDYWLPANVETCTGVAITVTDLMSYYVPGILGEFSLLLNNRKSHPLNFQTEWKTWRFRMDYLLQKLEEPLDGGSKINGYYLNHAWIPYNVKIYLQCIARQ